MENISLFLYSLPLITIYFSFLISTIHRLFKNEKYPQDIKLQSSFMIWDGFFILTATAKRTNKKRNVIFFLRSNCRKLCKKYEKISWIVRFDYCYFSQLMWEVSITTVVNFVWFYDVEFSVKNAGAPNLCSQCIFFIRDWRKSPFDCELIVSKYSIWRKLTNFI